MTFLTDSFSSIIASSTVYPIEVIKSQYQRNLVLNHNSNSIRHIVKNIHHNGGFYKGLGSNLISFPIFWGVYFQSNQYNKQFVNSYFSPDSFINKFITSSSSAIFASIVTNPLFVLKTRLQIENLVSTNNSSYNDILRNIYHKEGFAGYMKGIKVTALNSSKLGIQFPLYDLLHDKTNNVFISSAISKILTSTLFYPFDIIRTNQRDSINKISIRHVAFEIYKKHGFYGLYKGVGLYNLVSSSNFIIMMLIRDYINA